MFPKLASFRASLEKRGLADAPLYFAKVDVQSCFDTIPQQRLLSMVQTLLSTEEYQISKHVEISPVGQLQRLDGPKVEPLPVKRYVPHSRAAGQARSFDRVVQEQLSSNKANTIFVDTAVQQYETKDDLMRLLREHVERNLVKIGKKLYRQKQGIPQGSVLSSILCNFFYAEFERDVLGFALDEDSLLLRLLDDFLLITIHREHAERFVRVMHRGDDSYGIVVQTDKSLVNFDVEIEGRRRLTRTVSDSHHFPYCGVLIDTGTLEVSKKPDRGNRGGKHTSAIRGNAQQNALTAGSDCRLVDSKSGKSARSDFLSESAQVSRPHVVKAAVKEGRYLATFVLGSGLTGCSGFKIQLQSMFIDTSFNSVPTVLANLYHSFDDAAVRCLEYMRTLAKSKQTHPRLLISKSPAHSLMQIQVVVVCTWAHDSRRSPSACDYRSNRERPCQSSGSRLTSFPQELWTV
jgi:telomerase reverse transcriptase